NAPGRVEYRARPDAAEKPRGPAGASHGAIARRRARRKFQTDGPAARLHLGWRGNHALGLGQYFPEDPGGAAAERHTDLAGAHPYRGWSARSRAGRMRSYLTRRRNW